MPSSGILYPEELNAQLHLMKEYVCEDVRCEVRHALQDQQRDLQKGLEDVRKEIREGMEGVKKLVIGSKAWQPQPTPPHLIGDEVLRSTAFSTGFSEPVFLRSGTAIGDSPMFSLPEELPGASQVFPRDTSCEPLASPPVSLEPDLPGQIQPVESPLVLMKRSTHVSGRSLEVRTSFKQRLQRGRTRMTAVERTDGGVKLRRLKRLVKTLRGGASGVHVFSKEDFIEMFISLSIVLNGLFLGLQADHMARERTDTMPMFYVVSEVIFCSIFTVEILWKLAKFRSRFFCVPTWRWNLFDTVLVSLQLGDVFVELLFQNMPALETASTVKNAAFVRLLRLLRLLRILRMLRLLQFFGELNVVTSAIARSMRSLFGAVVMLLLVMYIIGIVFTQVTTTYRMGSEEDVAELVEWWGDLTRSMLTLYEAFLGGVDWDTLQRSLILIHPGWAIAFALYIAFITLAMMNVITGIFVESAIKNADYEKNRVFVDHVRGLATKLGDTSGYISKNDFRDTLQDAELQIYFRDLGIDSTEVLQLLDMLGCTDDQDGVEVEALIYSMARLRQGAKFLDVMTMLFEVDQQYQSLSDWLIRTDANVGRLSEHILGMTAAGPLPRVARVKPGSRCPKPTSVAIS